MYMYAKCLKLRVDKSLNVFQCFFFSLLAFKNGLFRIEPGCFLALNPTYTRIGSSNSLWLYRIRVYRKWMGWWMFRNKWVWKSKSIHYVQYWNKVSHNIFGCNMHYLIHCCCILHMSILCDLLQKEQGWEPWM